MIWQNTTQVCMLTNKQRKAKKFSPQAPVPIKKETSVEYRDTADPGVVKTVLLPDKDIIKHFKAKDLPESAPYTSKVNVTLNCADIVGSWSWGITRDWKTDKSYTATIDSFVAEYHQKKTWRDVFQETTHGSRGTRKKRNIHYKLNQICREAYKRLIELELDDCDSIFRFRLMCSFRLYGFIRGSSFIALWHDPEHDIYND